MANERNIPYREQRLNTQALHLLLRGQADKFAQLRQQHPEWEPRFTLCVLAGCNLSNFDLSNCSFQDVNFGETVCRSTNFSGSTIRRCNFEKTDLTEASFEGADIIRSLFNGATLVATSFECAHLVQTDILQPLLTSKNTEPGSTNLSRASIIGCRLSRHLFTHNTFLEYADFQSYIPSSEDDDSYKEDWDSEIERSPDTHIDADDDGICARATILLHLGSPSVYPEYKEVATIFSKAVWNTLLFDNDLQRRADLLPDSPQVALPEFTERPAHPKLSIPKEAALRMASKAFLKASTDLILEGVDQLPVAEETRQKLTTFFRGSKGQLLIAHLISFVLESGLIDHLPLLTDGMKDVLRKHLPEELRVSTFAKGFEELANIIGAHLFRLLREANLGAEATEPAASPPTPAALPEPAAKDPAPEPQRQKARVPRR